MDLGECTKIHDLALRADYEIASKERDLFFELDVSDDLIMLIVELYLKNANLLLTVTDIFILTVPINMEKMLVVYFDFTSNTEAT